jgi:S1-C subfamily serine protease
MRSLLLACSYGLGIALPALADGTLEFNGHGPGDTVTFSMSDRWEVRWQGPPTSVTVETATGDIVAGSLAAGNGSLYLPKGGTYKLHVNSLGGMPWHLYVASLDATSGTHGMTYSPPDAGDSFAPSMAGPSSSSSGNALMSSVPGAGVVPAAMTPANASASVPAAPPSPTAPAPNLTEAQSKAIVVVSGDNAEGTGFLVKGPDGPAVVTNVHVLANNPHIKITTNSGQPIEFVGLEGAIDRDLAMILIKDNGYSYLEFATDIPNTVAVGDQVLTPGNSQGGEVVLNTAGTVLGIGPQRVEFSNPIYHGNSGGPVFHVKSGKVIGVVTEAVKVDTTNDLDRSSFAARDSAIKAGMRYFGLRLDTVPKWEPYDWTRLENETAFLDQFHQRSRCLDSYLNTANNDQTEEGTLYLRDAKIKEANDNCNASLASEGQAGRLDALRTLAFDLGNIADTRLADVSVPQNFYGAIQEQAQEETEYRQALKREIESYNDDINRVGNLAR